MQANTLEPKSVQTDTKPVHWHAINTQVPKDLWKEIRSLTFERDIQVREFVTAALRRHLAEARRKR